MPLAGGKSIRVITAPFFLGTTMEAFRGRGKLDFQASHDLEDLVAVVEGRETLLQEIAASTLSLRRILADAAKILLAESRFLDVLPGFVLADERVPLIEGRLAFIAANIPTGECQVLRAFQVRSRLSRRLDSSVASSTQVSTSSFMAS